MRTIEALVDLYFQSVGRNSKLLLNVPPTPDGLLHPVDVARLTGCHARHTFSGVDGGAWRVLSGGTTIGYARLDRFEPAAVRRVRLVIEEAVAPPEPIGIKLY